MTGTKIGFDDIDTSAKGYAPVPDEYHGLDWNGFGAIDTTRPGFSTSGYAVGTTSGTQVGVNLHGKDAAVSLAGGSFELKSVELTSAFDSKMTVEITGFRNGAKVFDKIVTITDAKPTDVHLNLKGIDDIDFHPVKGKHDPSEMGKGSYIAFDDFVFGKIDGSAASGDLASAARLATEFSAHRGGFGDSGLSSPLHLDFQHLATHPIV